MTCMDTRALRQAMGNFCTGIVVVTGTDGSTPVGFTLQSFVSLSLVPPLIAICPARTSGSWSRIRATGAFAINILADDQQDLCTAMARSGGDKFAGHPWSEGMEGLPILDGAIGHVICDLAAEHDGGDHTIAVGAVRTLGITNPDKRPLLFFRGGYGGFGET